MHRALFLLLISACVASPAGPSDATPHPGAPACPVFPSDNVWHADVSGLPVHPRSADWIASMGGPDRRLHPDFGPSDTDQPYGIPYEIVPGDHPKVSVGFLYEDESDPGPYPFDAETPIEGGSDRHALMIDRDACVLYELFDAHHSPEGSTAGSGAVWDLRSNDLRPQTWTSADAAGLPIYAGLVRRDEVEAGLVDHAIRVTAARTDRRFVWPARHQAGHADDPALPPMGARFRLKASFPTSGYETETRVILAAMKRHGLMVADNGSNWYFGGASEQGWRDSVLDELKSIPAGAFEAVDGSLLMVDPDSGQARPASPYAVTAAARPQTVRPRELVRVSGRVTPAAPGRSVQIQRRTDGRWILFSSTTIRSDGTYRYSFRPRRSVRLRVVKPAGGSHLSGVSPSFLVTVRSA